MLKTSAKLIKHDVLNNSVHSFVLQSDEIALIAKPGQFVNIFLDGFFLGRPISICEIFKDSIRIIFEVRGEGTKKLSKAAVNSEIDLLGPLGHGFKKIKPTDRILTIGGGIGVFPLLALTKIAQSCVSLLGFRSKENVLLLSEFEKNCDKTYITTDDCSFGEQGPVTNILPNIITKHFINRIAACGPKPMLKKIAEFANNAGIFCEVCLEERMACGVGACLGCQCILKLPNNQLQSAHVCSDGPVFDAARVLLD